MDWLSVSLKLLKRFTPILVGCAIWATGGCAVTSPSASGGTDEINLRFVNLSPGILPIALALNGLEVTPRIGFQAVSDYVMVSTGAYDLSLRATSRSLSRAGSIPAGSELGIQFVEFEEGPKTYSVLAVEQPQRVTLLLLPETEPPEFDKAKIRFVNAVPQSTDFQWLDSRDETVIGPAVEFSSVTPYQLVDPGLVSISATHEERILAQSDFTLESFRVYTLYTTGLLSGDPEVEQLLVEEAKADEIL